MCSLQNFQNVQGTCVHVCEWLCLWISLKLAVTSMCHPVLPTLFPGCCFLLPPFLFCLRFTLCLCSSFLVDNNSYHLSFFPPATVERHWDRRFDHCFHQLSLRWPLLILTGNCKPFTSLHVSGHYVSGLCYCKLLLCCLRYKVRKPLLH